MVRRGARHGFFMTDATGEERVLAVIPARYASSRLPGKPLAEIAGLPMLEHVYRRACQARTVERVVVATDDERILRALEPVAPVVMTGSKLASGSDRVAEAARSLDCSIVVNIQGDLPLLDPSWVDALVERLRNDRSLGIATCAVPIRSQEEFENPSVVKVVADDDGRALYFSRAAIPYDREHPGRFDGALHHVGLYAYRREALLRFTQLPVARLERSERLEQLRALEYGIGIGVVVVDGPPPMEVDTPEDLERVRRAFAADSSTLQPRDHGDPAPTPEPEGT